MTYDLIVAGGGSMGMAAGYYAALAGRSVLIIDAYDPPHERGSHHGSTRIFRKAYAEGEQYVPLLVRAYELWQELERETDEPIYNQTGHLNAGRPHALYIRGVAESVRRHGLPVEILSRGDISRRWPGIALPADFVGYFEQEAGFLYSENVIRAYRRLAEKHGARILTHTRIASLSAQAGGVRVVTAGGAYDAGSLILTAGAKTAAFAEPLGLRLPVVPVRKTIGWFQADERYRLGQFPTFIIDLDTSVFYGFPDLGSGLKAGRHDSGSPVPDLTSELAPFGAEPEDEQELRNFLSGCLPGANGSLLSGKSCAYAMTPDEHFILDRHPQYPHIVIGAGFSGHGFKFTSAVGEALARMADGEPFEQRFPMFSLNRFA